DAVIRAPAPEARSIWAPPSLHRARPEEMPLDPERSCPANPDRNPDYRTPAALARLRCLPAARQRVVSAEAVAARALAKAMAPAAACMEKVQAQEKTMQARAAGPIQTRKGEFRNIPEQEAPGTAPPGRPPFLEYPSREAPPPSLSPVSERPGAMRPP